MALEPRSDKLYNLQCYVKCGCVMWFLAYLSATLLFQPVSDSLLIFCRTPPAVQGEEQETVVPAIELLDMQNLCLLCTICSVNCTDELMNLCWPGGWGIWSCG